MSGGTLTILKRDLGKIEGTKAFTEFTVDSIREVSFLETDTIKFVNKDLEVFAPIQAKLESLLIPYDLHIVSDNFREKLVKCRIASNGLPVRHNYLLRSGEETLNLYEMKVLIDFPEEKRLDVIKNYIHTHDPNCLPLEKA